MQQKKNSCNCAISRKQYSTNSNTFRRFCRTFWQQIAAGGWKEDDEEKKTDYFLVNVSI